MLQALLHGKLSRDQENMEDILTANIFGTFQFLADERHCLQFLALAQRTPDRQSRTLQSLAFVPESDVDVLYEFWPFWQEEGCISCEPDVVIRLNFSDGRRMMVLVEAKYKSGKSSFASADNRPHDQLAREWDNLARKAEREHREPILIYLTSSIGFPKEDIEDAINEFEEKRSGQGRPNIVWLSWRHIAGLFRDETSPICEALCSLCDRFELRFFTGLRCYDLSAQWSWQFNQLPAKWTRLRKPSNHHWSFRHELR
jgi:hypothetical protein